MANRRPLRGAFLIPPPQGAVADLTVSLIPLPVGVASCHRWVPVSGGLTLNLTDLWSWLLICRSSPTGHSYGGQLTGWAVTQ